MRGSFMTSCLLVTVTYNSGEILGDFLDDVSALVPGDLRRVELLVVDNDSTDETRNLLARHTEIHRVVLNRDNVGVAKANNQGIRYGLDDGFDWILLINNDVRIPAESVSRLVEGAITRRAAVVAPRIMWTGERSDVWFAGGRIRRWLGFRAEHLLDDSVRDPGATGYAPTTCLLVRADVFDTVGLMDERYFVYWDDVDFMLRLAEGGIAVSYDPAVTIWHAAGSLTGGSDSAFTLVHSSFGRALLMRTHGAWWQRPWDATFLVAWTLGRAVVRRDQPADIVARLRAFRRGWVMGRSQPQTGRVLRGAPS